MTVRAKPIYYYLAWVLFILNIPLALTAAYCLKELSLHHMIVQDWMSTLRAVCTISIQFMFLSHIFTFNEGYTIISTTKYNLFKCRQSGKDETFMMFADSEEELEKFFENTKPDNKFFIESMELTAESMQMKIYEE